MLPPISKVRAVRLPAALLLLVTGLTAPLLAQSSLVNATVVGTVADSQGAVIPGATASEQAVARAQVQTRLLDPFPVTHQAVGLKNRKQVGLEARDVRRAVAGGPQEGSEGSGENEHHPKVVPARHCGSAGADSRHELRSLAPYSRARPGSPELDTTGRSRVEHYIPCNMARPRRRSLFASPSFRHRSET